MYLAGEAPLPAEYEFMKLDELAARAAAGRAASASCSPSTARTRAASARTRSARSSAPLVIDIDHHHDNTRFGDINLIDSDGLLDRRAAPRPLRASSTSSSRPRSPRRSTSRSSPTPAGSSTRTRRPSRCGSPRSWSRPAPTSTASSRASTRTSQFAKLKLLARALERAQVYEGGRLVVSYLLRDDFRDVGAVEPYSEGIIDYLRGVEGADMVGADPRAAESGRARRGASRCARATTSSTSRRSRASRDGGGHRQAAGFSSERRSRRSRSSSAASSSGAEARRREQTDSRGRSSRRGSS